MTQLLGVDVSHYQTPPLPWTTWRGAGVRFAYIRHGLGYVGDWDVDRHRKEARAAGMFTGAYWVILKHDDEIDNFDPVQSARNFDQVIEPGDELPPMVDVEALGVTAGLLSAFLREFDRLRPGSGVGIYTSQHFWQMLIGNDHYEFAGRPLWVAQYGIGGQQDPPRLPDIWQQYVCWQWRYKKGYLPGYDKDLDINLWSGEMPMPATNDQLNGLLAEATAINTTSANMIAEIKAAIAASPVPPPPPPPGKHTLADKINNEVFTLFKKAFGDSYFAVVTAALDEAYMLAHRTELYKGPAIEDMPVLTATQKTVLIAAL